MRIAALVLVCLAAAAPLHAQHEHAAPAKAAGGEIAAGWQVRPDRLDAPLDRIRFAAMDDGWHASTGPAAIFWRDGMIATGEYVARATFTQTEMLPHPEAYGLFVGGRDLTGEAQDYLYFLVRQDGKFLVKHRAGAETHVLFDWTEHPAVRRPGEAGAATNTLALEASAEGARFIVNGTEVAFLQRVPYLNTDGIVGLRINHRLDLHIAGFEVEPAGNR